LVCILENPDGNDWLLQEVKQSTRGIACRRACTPRV